MKDIPFKALLKLSLISLYPVFLLMIFGFFTIPFISTHIREVIAFGFLAGMAYCVLLLFSSKTVKYILILIFNLLLSLLVAIKISFYYHYKVKVSASALFLIFETNETEAKDFLVNYFDFKVIAIFIIALIPVFFVAFSKYVRSYIKELASISKAPVLIKVFLLLFFVFAVYQINLRFRPYNLYLTYVDSYKEYVVLKDLLKKNLSQPTSEHLEVIETVKETQTHIVVIGESTSNWHMQLYGYPRETNPKLSEIRDELVVFDSVITPNVHTILALDKILTLSNNEEPNKIKNASVIQLANQSGFTTYWLSNQRPVGIHDAMSTQIGAAATYKHFLATDNYTSATHDEILLPKLDDILDDTHTKRLIFIHLGGTHISYNKRYPETYNYFTKNNELQTARQNELINEYDNAVLYNDYIVREIIDKLRAERTKSYMLYFSDHGDEVFDTMDYAGHNEYHNTPPMYEIPFLLWFSKDFKESEKIVFETKRPYNLEHFIHSFSDLTKLSFKGIDSTKSIFSDYKINTVIKK